MRTWDFTEVRVRQLDSGYWHLRGPGPCNWAQPQRWPCLPDDLEKSFFGEAGEGFRACVRAENDRLLRSSRETAE
jgi:hypothetical protein